MLTKATSPTYRSGDYNQGPPATLGISPDVPQPEPRWGAKCRPETGQKTNPV